MDKNIKVNADLSLSLKDQTAFALKLYKGEKEGWHTVKVGEKVTIGYTDFVVVSIEPNQVSLRLAEDEINGKNL